MRGCRRVGCNGFRIAQVVGDNRNGQRIEELKRRCLATFEIQGQNSAAFAIKLCLDQIVLCMGFEAGIDGPLECVVTGQRLGNCQRRVRLRVHTQVDGFQPLQQHPGRERAKRAAGVFHVRFQRASNIVFGAKHHTA